MFRNPTIVGNFTKQWLQQLLFWTIQSVLLSVPLWLFWGTVASYFDKWLPVQFHYIPITHLYGFVWMALILGHIIGILSPFRSGGD